MTAPRQTTTSIDTTRMLADLDRLKADPAFGTYIAQLRSAPGPSFKINVGSPGSDTLQAKGHDNIFLGFDGDDHMAGGPGRNLMAGGRGDDVYVLRNGSDTVLEYQDEGNDIVSASADYTLPDHVEILLMNGNQARVGAGNADKNIISNIGTRSVLIDGRAGDDALFTAPGTPQAFLIGGQGTDMLFSLPEVAIVAANQGDGSDHVTLNGVRQLTLSLGKGITQGDLSLRKAGQTLVLSTGAGERIELAGYYDAATDAPRRIVLQMAVAANDQYDASSDDPMRNRRFVQFDLDQVVRQFDQQLLGPDALDTWPLATALPEAQLRGTATVVGGTLASVYAEHGNMASLTPEACRTALDQVTWQTSAVTLDMLPLNIANLSDLFNRQQTAYPTSAALTPLATDIAGSAAGTGNSGNTLLPRLNSSATTSSLNVSMAQLQTQPLLGTPG